MIFGFLAQFAECVQAQDSASVFLLVPPGIRYQMVFVNSYVHYKPLPLSTGLKSGDKEISISVNETLPTLGVNPNAVHNHNLVTSHYVSRHT